MSIFLEAFLIFGLRVLGMAVSTLATLTIVQGRRLPAVAASFVGALFHVVAIGKVVANLNNVWNILAYCGGYAVGTLVGMVVERRLALGFAEVRLISTEKGHALAEALRQAGFGVTEFGGHGRERTVDIVAAVVPRKRVGTVLEIAKAADEDAVVTVTEPRVVQRGYWNPGTRS